MTQADVQAHISSQHQQETNIFEPHCKAAVGGLWLAHAILKLVLLLIFPYILLTKWLFEKGAGSVVLKMENRMIFHGLGRLEITKLFWYIRKMALIIHSNIIVKPVCH